MDGVCLSFAADGVSGSGDGGVAVLPGDGLSEVLIESRIISGIAHG